MVAVRSSKTIAPTSHKKVQRRPEYLKENRIVSRALSLKKNLGQHLLKNAGVLDQIIRGAELKSTDTVLEIGPGTGNLTIRLLPLVRSVVALDIDERMVKEVKKRALSLGYMNLNIMHGDALKSDLGVFNVCVANLPYQISSPFIFKLLAHRPLFRTAVLMFQKEFAERLLARPNEKQYCRLSVNTQMFCHVEKVCSVSAGSFNPPPKVDSMVVRLSPRKSTFEIDFKEWDGLLRVCFMRKSKTLRSIFMISSVLRLLESNYMTWCQSSGIPTPQEPFKSVVENILRETNLSDKRSLSINLNKFLELLLAFHKRNIHFTNIREPEIMDLD